MCDGSHVARGAEMVMVCEDPTVRAIVCDMVADCHAATGNVLAPDDGRRLFMQLAAWPGMFGKGELFRIASSKLVMASGNCDYWVRGAVADRMRVVVALCRTIGRAYRRIVGRVDAMQERYLGGGRTAWPAGRDESKVMTTAAVKLQAPSSNGGDFDRVADVEAAVGAMRRLQAKTAAIAMAGLGEALDFELGDGRYVRRRGGTQETMEDENRVESGQEEEEEEEEGESSGVAHGSGVGVAHAAIAAAAAVVVDEVRRRSSRVSRPPDRFGFEK